MKYRLALFGVAALSMLATALRSADVSYILEPVADGVYRATGPGPIAAGCNSAIIVTNDGVVVVDSGHTAQAARALIHAIGTVTDQPIRYVINTHHHFDHTFGNEAFPLDAVIIGHEYTKAKLSGTPMKDVSITDVMTSLRTRIDRFSQPSERDNADSQAKLAAARSYLEALTQTTPRPPSRTFADTMTLSVGGREIRLIWLGRGHTAGDVVVFLPREKIVCTGDLYGGSVGYQKEAFVNEWPEALTALAKLDAAKMIPGHGPVLTDRAQLFVVRDCLQEMWRQTAALEAAGVPAQSAAPQIDLTRFAEKLPQFKSKGLAVASVSRMYEVIRENRATHR